MMDPFDGNGLVTLKSLAEKAHDAKRA